MKKLFPCIIIVLFVWCTPAHALTGSGTELDPYLVTSAADLDDVRDDLTAHYKQTAHIDLSGVANWVPIAGGGTLDKFSGSYNGQHYTISNLTIDRDATANVGLFGHVDRGGVIRNVCLEDVDVVGARGTGSLIGRVTGDATTLIERCSAKTGTVTGDAATGGLIGSHNSWRETAGGTDNPVVSQCFADINVIMSANGSDKQKFGGLAGCSQKGTIIDSYARGSVNTEAATALAPAERVGGLAGCILLRGELIRCFSTGAVTVNAFTTFYGGLLGRITAGGNSGVVVDSYWDTETSGMTTSAAGFPRTTTEMQTESTYATFDFTNTWGLDPAKNNGYPYLLWEDDSPTVDPPAPTVELKNRRGLELDGVIDHLIIDHDGALDVDAANQVTVEAWVRKSSDQTDAAGTGNIAVLQNHDSYNLFLEDGNEPAFSIVDDSATTRTASSGFPLETGKWYHLAGTFNNNAVRIYINGFEYTDGTVTPGAVGVQDAGSRVGIGVNVTGIETIGIINYPSEGFLHGGIDEVRVWDTARTETTIRDTMCRKLTGAEGNLVGYWRLDEAYGVTCKDDSPNTNDGTILSASRSCSAAPVGDDSDHDYTEGDGYLVTDTTNDQSLTVEEDGGTWSAALKSAIQVYRMNHAPDYTAGPFRWRLIGGTGFWGVFITGGSGATYKMEYNYDVSADGFPGIADETDLRIAYRTSNCEPWKDLGATLGANPLTRSGLFGTEFILGTDGEPRNAIDFDGSSDYVTVSDDNTLDLDDEGTLEAWIYPEAFTADAGIVLKGTSDGINNTCYGFGLGGGGTVFTGGAGTNIGFVVGNSGGGVYRLTGTSTLSTGRWYHVACVWENTGTTDSMTIYINGVQEASSAANIDNAATTSGEALNIGRQAISATDVYFQGTIDEVRVWNTARSQTDIRDTMCQKLSGSESGLVGYWRFDEETDSTTCPDLSTQSNSGTMTSFADVRAARICSSAPIGDDSAYGYYDSGALSPVTAQMTHSDGDYLQADENTGTWTGTFSGIQIYRLDEAPLYPPDLWTTPSPPYSYTSPNGLTPPSGWSSVDYYRYWGVFTTDWLNTPKTYDATYYYHGNPSVPDDDSVVGLASRDDYCDRSWSASGATLNTGADTLTKTLEAGTEYVLGGKDAPLVIELASFTAEIVDGCILITWETATEIGTAGFYLWRSDQKEGLYSRIDDSFTPAEGTETVGATYEYRDCDIDDTGSWYYKLEEVVSDAAEENAFYGPIGPTAQSLKAAGADDTAAGSDSGSGCFISVLAE